jgi:glycyl-tRNA synthetase beta chain
LAEYSEDKPFERRGPAASAAFQDGEPSKALLGFCRGLGIAPDDTEMVETDKGQWVVYRDVDRGRPSQEILPELCSSVSGSLNLSKPMRWGHGRDEFPRPVHWILAMIDDEVVPMALFGLDSGNQTFGHRFMAPDPITIDHAGQYHRCLTKAYVIADFEQRQRTTWDAIQQSAREHGVAVELDEGLLTEINCLVEWPVALCGEFEKRFLNVPEIALIAAMKGHQKYFHTRDKSGRLSNRFITVSNIESKDPDQVIAGNQRVIKARLSDAKFFFDLDKKETLAARRPRLDNITFHPKLGSLGAKTERVQALGSKLAQSVGANVELFQRVTALSRCDLVTEMVLEFDELQGQMGTIYASLDGEPNEVARAIEGLYQPAGASDQVPNNLYGTLLALTDRLDTLAGLFSINQPPTGSKDPFALRRAAIGTLRLNEFPELRVDLTAWITEAFAVQPEPGSADQLDALVQFIKDRERVRLIDKGYRHDMIVAVQETNRLATAKTEDRVKALIAQSETDEFATLVSTNKRVANLLKESSNTLGAIDPELFEHPCEATVFGLATRVSDIVDLAVSRETYGEAIESLFSMKPATEAFFDNVMIHCDQEAVRTNRLRLCQLVKNAYSKLADFSLIQQ